MTKRIHSSLPSLFIFLFFFTSLTGQEVVADSSVQREDGLRIFIDCTRCDMNYIREEIPYVNYVRDVKEAQLLYSGDQGDYRERREQVYLCLYRTAGFQWNQ